MPVLHDRIGGGNNQTISAVQFVITQSHVAYEHGFEARLLAMLTNNAAQLNRLSSMTTRNFDQ